MPRLFRSPRPVLPFLLAVACGLAVVLWLVGTPDAAPAVGAGLVEDLPPGGGPVVVELFTSQGCSSCPPADRLLSEIGEDPDLSTRVFPLAFHVDYWNYIGWTDPFSSERWSERQRAYARAFDSNRVYTPQLVVDGRTDCVGSQERKVERSIRRALEREPAGRVSLRLTPGENPDRMRAAAEASLREGLSRPPVLWVALYQTDRTTSVARGENADRTLHNDYVVRRLHRAFALPEAVAGTRASGEVTLELEPSWERPDLGVVAFLQDPETLEIHGAARATLAVIQ